MRYADILTQVLREKSGIRYPLQPGLKVMSSCDQESGQFLLIVIGWDRDDWHHSILFHAQIVDGKVIIEADMTEGLKPSLLEGGISEEHFLSDQDRDQLELEQIAA